MIESPNTNDGRIKFGNVSTRAAVTNAAAITEFGVMAEMNLGADGSPEALQWVPLLENERVYRGSDNNFTYDNTRYWVEDRTFFFFAVYPYGTSVTRTEETIEHNGNNATKFQYSVNVRVPYSANTDFLVAQCSVPTKEITDLANYPTVGLEFEHLLSQIKVKVKKSTDNANDQLTVTQVGLSDISRTATFDAVHTPNLYTETFSVVDQASRVRRQNLNVELETTDKQLFGVNDGLLVLPQDISSAKLTLTYTYKEEGTNEEQYSTIEVGIATKDVKEWTKGKIYTYSLTLAKDHNIYIGTPTVSDWGIAQAGGTIIIQ